jgi:branched-chain amino acid transport system ATP-binding protein
MPEPLLEVRALDAFYGDFQALFGVSLRVAAGEVVAVIGANGAGKSTVLKCIAGVIASGHDAILFDGEPIGDAPAHTVVARGIALVPEGHRRPAPTAGAVEFASHLRAVPGAGGAAPSAEHLALRR